MKKATPVTIWFDFLDAGRTPKFLPNVSAVAAAGKYLWTASGEMRTVECLEPNGEGCRLRRQFELDKLFPSLPGAQEALEAGVEALDVAHGRLWVCGSHSMTQRSRNKSDPRSRRSTHSQAAQPQAFG
jgi:hypothetical protein